MEPGDKVLICTDREYRGILMPRPEILDQDVLVLKLENGYNIGINKKSIKSHKVLSKARPKRLIPEKIRFKQGLPTISLLSLGGTISSKIDYATGGTYADYSAGDFVNMFPELAKVANLKVRKVLNGMSEDFGYREYSIVAKAVYDELMKGVDGVVLTSGTDTLHWLSAALSFALPGLDKPVIITASQRSIDRGSSDAFMNLFCAIKGAASFDGAGVMTCMHGTSNDDFCLLIRGTKVRKMHTSRRDAFRPINEQALAKVFYDGRISIFNRNYPKRNKKECMTGLADNFSRKVALVAIYPGISPDIIDYYADKGYEGLVIAGTALGHVPTENSENNMLPAIKRARKKMPVVIATQTLYGSVHPYVYTNLIKLSIGAGCIFAGDMLPEVACIKLAWLLGNGKDPEDMLVNYVEELNQRSDYQSYLA